MKIAAGPWLLLAAFSMAACQQSSVPEGKPLVVVSVFPVFEFARQVAGDRAQVISLVPTGVEPHDWEASPQDMAEVRRARLFVYNGAGLEQVPVMGLAPESEPSPAALAAIVSLARQRKVEAVFFETLVNRRLADTLAREIGARTLLLNPIEGLTHEEAAAGKGYLDLMAANLANLREGLGCR